MITSAPRRNTLALTGILSLAAATAACSGAEDADMRPDVSSTTSPTTSSSLVEGEMDSGGSSAAPPSWNESPDGRVTTTLGDYVVGVRSKSPIAHWFQEARPGAPEFMHIAFALTTVDGRMVTFDFEYTGVKRTFSLGDSGAFSIFKNDEELLGRGGTVTIEPVGADAVKVSFEQIVVGPENEVGGAEVLGNGLVEGPLCRLCNRAADV